MQTGLPRVRAGRSAARSAAADGGQEDLIGAKTVACRAHRSGARVLGFERGRGLIDGIADRAVMTERPVERNGERACRGVGDRVVDANDTVDLASQRIGDLGAVAS